MKQVEIVIRNPSGLHARPAKVFVNIAKQFKSDIRVVHGSKKANAKSLISMLTLGVETGSQIVISVDGEDEEVALQTLEQAVAEGLGEGEQLAQAAAPPKPAAPKAPTPAAPAGPVATKTTLPDNVIKGVAAAPGIAVGPVFQVQQAAIKVDDTFTGAAEEKARLRAAVTQAQEHLVTLREQMVRQGAASEADIFDVHRELLVDPEITQAVEQAIDRRQSAARAWKETISQRAEQMAALSDPLLAARAADLRDVGDRVLRVLMGVDGQGIGLPDHPVVIVAEDLSPSETASLNPKRVLGFCTAAGGPTAHAAIIARALGLPAVVSAGPRVLDLAGETPVILNGNNGLLTVEPDEAALAEAQAAQEKWRQLMEAAEAASGEPAITTDGHRVEVAANIGGLEDARQAVAAGAEAVGLLRTEFLFLDRTAAPSEEEQYEVYRDIAQAMSGQPVIVRTLDIGGDKPLPYIDVPHEANPFLGERGLRLCLARPELLRQQVRAILRAASAGPLRIMFPMVASLSEWQAARAIVEEVRAELGVPAVEMGIMIEVPSAALTADAFAREVDFFSVGTNDLTQYTLAMDRMHPTLAAQSDAMHPAVLRLIARTVEAAHKNGKWVGICGALGSDPEAVPVLVGLGIDELSVSTPSVPAVKAQVRTLALSEARRLAEQVLACATAGEVRDRVRSATAN